MIREAHDYMSDPELMEPATKAAGSLDGLPGLTLDEELKTGVWVLKTGSPESTTKIAVSLAGRVPGLGEMIDNHQVRILRYSPDTMYLLFNLESAPNLAQELKAFVTDISHGMCELILKGEKALDFIGDYVSVSVNKPRNFESGTLRCRIGHFKVLIWWSDESDVHILVERSFAQSFYDYMLALSLRWSGYCPGVNV
jgi:heterotetrameric sarcosine oxidase gamma subunit